MLRTAGLFLLTGFIWLFLFSFPIGQGKTLYQLGQHFIVKTTPVEWLGRKITTGYEATLEATNEPLEKLPFRELPEKYGAR
jgi:uncharacterized membrane-anchored protein